MQVLPRWRNVSILKSTVTQSIATTTAAANHLAWFHSTNALSEKWKDKFNFDVKGDQQPSKNYIRYAVRQKRADTKRALKNILFNGGCSPSRTEVCIIISNIDSDYTDKLNKKSRLKPPRRARKARHKKSKRKHRKENMFEDFDENPDTIFRATFGKHGFSWKFTPSGMGFDWRENSGWSNSRYKEHGSRSGVESDDDAYIIGTYADRKILGLPTAGPLKIEDVKTAFRLSALKWHPDKHQGSSQADAEEKFKHCIDAYKSLCDALSTA